VGAHSENHRLSRDVSASPSAAEARSFVGGKVSLYRRMAPRKAPATKRRITKILRLGGKSRLAIHVVEGAAAPADEISPSWIYVVTGAVVKTGPEIGLSATAGFPRVSAFVFSCSTLFVGFLARFFVSHGVSFRFLV
jgi:hypothetical protein